MIGGFGMAQVKVGVIVVDVQGDFTHYKHGSLAVPGTDKAYIEKVEKATRALKKAGFPVFATQDWHPKDHISFYTNHPGKKPFDVINIDGRTQVLWPPHCIQKTPGAKILIDNRLFDAIIQKGIYKNYDCYSGFEDDGGHKTELNDILQKHKITTLVVYGIATDYCVKATIIDAVNLGYHVIFVNDLCRGVSKETSRKAINEMRTRGVEIWEGLKIEKLKAMK